MQTSRPETAALQPQYQTETRSTTLAAAAYDNDDTSAVSIMWSSFSRGRITAVYDLYDNFTGDKQLRYDICFVLWLTGDKIIACIHTKGASRRKDLPCLVLFIIRCGDKFCDIDYTVFRNDWRKII